jgi:hypothetical protein
MKFMVFTNWHMTHLEKLLYLGFRCKVDQRDNIAVGLSSNPEKQMYNLPSPIMVYLSLSKRAFQLSHEFIKLAPRGER